MKLLGIFRFEVRYQLGRPWPWLSMLVLALFAFFNTRIAIVPVTLPQDFILNSPFIIAAVTVFSCQIWLLLTPMVSGEAAARDVQTGMYPLTYTSPVTRSDYLGGRFLAALVLHSLILVAVQVGSLLAVHVPGMSPEIIGPFRPGAYLRAYALIALPNALIAASVQFTAALVSGRPIASYVGSMALFFLSYPVTFALYFSPLGKHALLADPIGIMAIMNEMMSNWTIVEKNVRMFTLDGPMLMNRLLWVGIALLTLAIVHRRFRFEHRTESGGVLGRIGRRFGRAPGAPGAPEVRGGPGARGRLEAGREVSIPRVRQSFGFATRARQTLAIARSSFSMIARSPAGLFLLAVFPAFVVLVLLMQSEQWGIPLVPRTGYIVSKFLTAPLTHLEDFRIMVPLLIVYFAGELVWRERDAGLSETVDATPVTERVLLAGKFVGLGLVLTAFLGSLTLAGMMAQTIRGHQEYEVARYAQLLLGFQLPEYLLFAMLAFLVQIVANQKYLGLIVSLVAYFLIVFSPYIGFEHKLLVYGASPAWYYTDMRGFGGSVGPWVWFKLYWGAWALLLALAGRLLWVRGRDDRFMTRLRVARLRFDRAAMAAAVATVLVIAALGGFVFYNTNVLHEYITDGEMAQRQAEYERRYGRYEGIPQPQRAATNLHIEIRPGERSATVRGSYTLVNRDTVAIGQLHLEPAFYVETNMTLDRPATLAVADAELGHHIYELIDPLQPGDSLTLDFDVRLQRRGFSNSGPRSTGAGAAILRNGSHFDGGALPVIGYQPLRELWSAEDRRKQGLPRQLTLPPPGDIDAHKMVGAGGTFEAVVGTDAGQVAVAPGELRRTWTEGGRSYFHYASDVPVDGQDLFFSAAYEVRREQRSGVDVQLFIHPGHTAHAERVLRAVRASLDYYSAQFGPYPWPFLQVVEQPGNFLGMGVDGSGVITGGEGFFLLDPKGDGFDAIFEVVAHEMGHQWWGMQLQPAFAEGGGVISEGLAWYSAMQLVKHVKGREALRRFMSTMREPNPWPPIRTGLPLLRAMDPWANYRKAPYAMHALSEYMGDARVNAALRSLIDRQAFAPATTLDMYRELQAAAPDSLKPLLHDLFEVNTFWTFDTKQANARETAEGAWEVRLEVEAHKVVTDSAGRDTEVPIGEAVEIGVFAPAEPGEMLGKPLYVRKHAVRSGAQIITVLVPEEPARGGIDPYNLLDWEEGDNIEPIGRDPWN